MKRTALCLMLCPIVLAAAPFADDVVVRAMKDELNRSTEKLALGQFDPPYYIAYTTAEITARHCAAQDGGLLADDRQVGREGRADVRVGSAQLDSGNTDFTRNYSTSLTIDNDYDALRRDWWLTTDRKYKRALEALEKRRARRASRPEPSKTPTFALQPEVKQAPDTAGIQNPPLEHDCTALARRLSSLPYETENALVESAEATVLSQRVVRTFVSSAGGIGQSVESFATVEVVLRGRTPKGEPVVDTMRIAALRPEQIADQAVLEQRVRELTARFAATQNAERATEAYTGPILIEGRAAAQLARIALLPGFLGSPPPEAVGQAGDPPNASDALRIGRRILPTQFEVFDDPTIAELAGVPLLGTYVFDHEGIVAQRTPLVEAGVVRGLLMSRAPTDKIQKSTGHGRGSSTTVSPANFVVSARGGVDRKALERQLLARAKREGLDHAYVVSLLNDDSTRGGNGADEPDVYAALRDGSAVPLQVLVAYRIDANGRKPVRGVHLARPLMRDMRHIAAWGKTANADHDPGVRNPGPGYYSPSAFVTPSTVLAPDLLIEEAELVAAPPSPKPRAYPMPQ